MRPTRMNRWLPLLIMAAFCGCEKNDIFPTFDDMQAQGDLPTLCMNGKPVGPGKPNIPDFPNEPDHATLEKFKRTNGGRQPVISPYQQKVFADEFNGAAADHDSPPGCYTMQPRCAVRLDWTMEGSCAGNDFTNLRDLNKCVWTVWSGYSFWENSGKLSYVPSQVDVSGGSLNFRITDHSSDSDLDCGPTDAPETFTVDRWKVNCHVRSGGVDSTWGNSTTHGYNLKRGRVDIRAAIPEKDGLTVPNSWPALWSWADTAGVGYPYISEQTAWVPEYDMLEAIGKYGQSEIPAYQTYHTWYHAGGPHTSSGTREDIHIRAGKFETFGVERYEDYMLYYTGQCYTRLVKNGDPEGKDIDASYQHGGILNVSGDSVLRLTLGMGLDRDFLNHSFKDIDGGVFKIDYVRIYEASSGMRRPAPAGIPAQRSWSIPSQNALAPFGRKR